MLQSRNLQGLGGTQPPRGSWWKAWGGQTLPLKAEGMGSLTPRPSPLCPPWESSGELGPEAEPGGSSHRCPWARGWDALGRAPGSPTSARPIKSRCGSCQSSPHPFDTRPHPFKDIFVYTELVPVRMVMEVTAMMQNMYTYTIQVYALVLTVKESFKPRMKKFRPLLPIIPMQPAYQGLIQIHLKQ